MDDTLVTPPAPSRNLPHQITVYPEDEHDDSDPKLLQVPAPPGQAAWVLAGARALVELTGGDPADLATVVSAQRIMAAIAWADAAVVATVTEISEPIEPSGPVPLHEVEFATQSLIHGDEVADTFTARLANGGSCAPPIPGLDSTWLALVHVSGSLAYLTRNAPLRPIVGGVIGGGLLPCTPSELAAACAAADEEVGP